MAEPRVGIPPSIMPGKWSELTELIRSSPGKVCWELFAGNAGLSLAFANEGWKTAPPIDIVMEPEFDLLNPLFLVLVLGIILEGWISVLHLGPPCSSFSMAFNRFLSQAIHSAAHPAGLPGLTPEQQEKVRVGNALAEVALILAKAQTRASG